MRCSKASSCGRGIVLPLACSVTWAHAPARTPYSYVAKICEFSTRLVEQSDRVRPAMDSRGGGGAPPSVLDGSPPPSYLAFSSASLSARCQRALLSFTLPSIPLTARVRGICEPSAFRLPQSFCPPFTAFSCTYVKRAVMWSCPPSRRLTAGNTGFFSFSRVGAGFYST